MPQRIQIDEPLHCIWGKASALYMKKKLIRDFKKTQKRIKYMYVYLSFFRETTKLPLPLTQSSSKIRRVYNISCATSLFSYQKCLPLLNAHFFFLFEHFSLAIHC